MTSEIKNIQQNCIDCDICQKNCAFLEKYKINLKGFSEKPDLAYHCFMCGRCQKVCPKNLNGRRLALEFREKEKQAFTLLRWQKNLYKFRNNSSLKSHELIFFGCNFTAFFPETTKFLIDLFGPKGVDFSIDCCGKPLSEAGWTENSDRVVMHLKNLFDHKASETVYCVCPNCYYFFKQASLPVRVLPIYELLKKYAVGEVLTERLPLYLPCPDRKTQDILNSLSAFVPNFDLPFEKINCCGAGGLAQKVERDIAEGWRKKTARLCEGKILTYCATCCSQFRKDPRLKSYHALSEILNIHEVASPKFLKNAVQLKFFRSRRRFKDI